MEKTRTEYEETWSDPSQGKDLVKYVDLFLEYFDEKFSKRWTRTIPSGVHLKIRYSDFYQRAENLGVEKFRQLFTGGNERLAQHLKAIFLKKGFRVEFDSDCGFPYLQVYSHKPSCCNILYQLLTFPSTPPPLCIEEIE